MSLFPLVLLTLAALWGVWQGRDVYTSLTRGAAEGLRTLGRIVPALGILLPVAAAFRLSGAQETLTRLAAPLLSALGIPPETVGLMLLRPLSGSAALAAGGTLMEQYGADSLVGRTAAVMLGSTETTFYVLSVYFAAVGEKRPPRVLGAALCADVAGFLAAAWTVKWLFG